MGTCTHTLNYPDIRTFRHSHVERPNRLLPFINIVNCERLGYNSRRSAD